MQSSIYIGSKNKTIDHIRQQNPNQKLVLVDNLESQIKNYSMFFDADNIYLIDNPTNEEIKTISSLSYSNQYKLFFEEESFDGRNSFIAKLKKSNLIFDFSFPNFGDTQSLQRYISKELKNLNINMDYDCYAWILQNCPTYKVKVKNSGNKKEKLVYDVDLLIQEIIKLSSLSSNITLSDFQNSVFKNDSDIFEFIEYVMNKQLDEALDSNDKLLDSIGDQALLLILLSQLYFMIVVADCKQKNIYNVDKIIEHLECKDILGKYLNEDWLPTNFQVKPQNPIRVRIELNKPSLPVEIISQMIEWVVETIKNLRDSGSKHHAMFILINKLVSV